MQKVQWIKISTDFLDGSSFKFIKRAKIDGIADFRDKLESVWFELLALAGKVNNNGCFYNDEVDYNNVSDLAIMLDREDKELELCLKFYLKHKMITVSDNTYQLENWCKFQNVTALEDMRENNRIRQQKYREKQKIKQINNAKVELCNVTSNVIVPATLSRDLDLDLERDKDKESITNKDIGQIDLTEQVNLEQNANAKSLKDTKESKTESNIKLFEIFWANYPKKVGKQKCLKWFKSRKLTSELVNHMIDTINAYKGSEEWKDSQYIPHPYTWLNRGGWDDELEVSNKSSDIRLTPEQVKEQKAKDQEELDLVNNIDLSDILGD